MSLVVDGSVAIKWYVRESWHEEALEIAGRRADLLAPDSIVAEVTDAAWRKALRGEITRRQALDIAARIGAGTPALCESGLLNQEALRIGLAIGHPVHGCLYLACARLFDCLVVTGDRRLCRAVEGTVYAPLVAHVSEREPP